MSELHPTGLSDNAAGAIAYLTFVPATLFLLIPPYNTNPYVRFHAWQSLMLNLTAILISFLMSFALVFFLVFEADMMLALKRMIWSVWLLVWLICVLEAMNGKRFKLPILGTLAEWQATK